MAYCINDATTYLRVIELINVLVIMILNLFIGAALGHFENFPQSLA